jgi:cytochrome c biogenesis protein CcdA
MLNSDSDKQKSPQRRFLFILGAALFVVVVILGVMIMFWDKLPLHLSSTQRYTFGGLFILYGVLRFIRVFRADTGHD